MDPWLEHKQHLLSSRRCPHCAEVVGARRILRGVDCPRCDAPLHLDGTEGRAAEVLAAIRTGWRTSRAAVYTAVLGATFLSGWIPLLASLVTAAAMLTANLVLIRRPLRWLPPVPRTVTRIASRLWFVVLVLISMALNSLAAPLIAAWGLGAVASAVIGAVSTFLYVEGSLWLVTRAVGRAASVPEVAT